MSNAQVAASGSVLAGIALALWARRARQGILLPQPMAAESVK